MKNLRLVVPAVATLTLLCAACAAYKPLMISGDPKVHSRDILESGCAFIVLGKVDVEPLLPEVAAAFKGDVAAGERFVREQVMACLRGEESWRENPPRLSPMIELGPPADRVDWSADITIERDEYGMGSITLVRPDSLVSRLGQAGARHVVVFAGLRLQRATSGPVGDSAGKGAVLRSEVFIVETDNQAVVWHGYLDGYGGVYVNFTKSTFESAAYHLIVELVTMLE